MGFPGSSVGKESACSAGDLGATPGLGGSPGEGNGNPPQSCGLESPVEGGARWAAVHGVSSVANDLATQPPLALFVYFIVERELVCLDFISL